MSNAYYDKLLSEVMVELKDLIIVGENQLASNTNLPKSLIEQQQLFNQHYQTLYVKYVHVYNKLEVGSPLSELFISGIHRTVMIKCFTHKKERI